MTNKKKKTMRMETDKIQHFAVCAVIAFAFAMIAYAWGVQLAWPALLGVGVAMLAGLGKELYDLWDYGRFDWRDMEADFYGGVTGAGVWLIVSLFI